MKFPNLILGLALTATSLLLSASTTPTSTSRGAWMYEPCDRSVDDPAQCIAEVLQAYPGDGAGWLEQGVQLSKALVAHTATFLKVAAEHRKQFENWLTDLDGNTFSTFVEGGSVEAQLQHAYLGKLRELMIEALKKHPAAAPHHDLADKALKRVLKVEISDL